MIELPEWNAKIDRDGSRLCLIGHDGVEHWFPACGVLLNANSKEDVYVSGGSLMWDRKNQSEPGWQFFIPTENGLLLKVMGFSWFETTEKRWMHDWAVKAYLATYDTDEVLMHLFEAVTTSEDPPFDSVIMPNLEEEEDEDGDILVGPDYNAWFYGEGFFPLYEGGPLPDVIDFIEHVSQIPVDLGPTFAPDQRTKLTLFRLPQLFDVNPWVYPDTSKL